VRCPARDAPRPLTTSKSESSPAAAGVVIFDPYTIVSEPF
jgi:hypothetical protein